MPESTEKSLSFLYFLDSVGLIVPEKMKDLEERVSRDENSKLIFEISSYFHGLNASDWFDVATSLYSTWLHHSDTSNQNLQYNSTQESPKTATTVTSNINSKIAEAAADVTAHTTPNLAEDITRSTFKTPKQQKTSDKKNV